MSNQIRVVSSPTVSTPHSMSSFIRKSQLAKPASAMPHFEKKNASKMCSFLVVIIAALSFVSCRKDQLSNPTLNSTTANVSLADAKNSVPKVNAGPVRRIVIAPTSSRTESSNSAILCGRASDNEGPVTVQWTQTRGNTVAVIADPTNDTTTVSNLESGVYTFVLTVTDITGTSRRDSTSVTILQKMTWEIEGVTREALVHVPTGGSGPAPVIFAFHGHGGTSLGFAERGFEMQWPEAIVVYPQGLRTKIHSDPTGKDAGWQGAVGEVNFATGIQDQDLKFFDAMLSSFKENYHIAPKLVFAHGWSNGGGFIYNALWPARGNELTAIAPAAALLRGTDGKKPLPIIHIAGTSDPNVHFKDQQKTVQTDRTLDECASTGTTWATGPNKMFATEYASPINAQVVSLQYDGGHAYPFTVAPYIVKFFKQVAGL